MTDARYEAAVQALAEIAHASWAGWARWMIDQWSPDSVARWERQIATPYANLTEQEKESDRVEARRYVDAYAASLRARLDDGARERLATIGERIDAMRSGYPDAVAIWLYDQLTAALAWLANAEAHEDDKDATIAALERERDEAVGVQPRELAAMMRARLRDAERRIKEYEACAAGWANEIADLRRDAAARPAGTDARINDAERLYALGCDIQIHPRANREHDWINEVLRFLKRIIAPGDRAAVAEDAPVKYTASKDLRDYLEAVCRQRGIEMRAPDDYENYDLAMAAGIALDDIAKRDALAAARSLPVVQPGDVRAGRTYWIRPKKTPRSKWWNVTAGGLMKDERGLDWWAHPDFDIRGPLATPDGGYGE